MIQDHHGLFVIVILYVLFLSNYIVSSEVNPQILDNPIRYTFFLIFLHTLRNIRGSDQMSLQLVVVVASANLFVKFEFLYISQ